MDSLTIQGFARKNCQYPCMAMEYAWICKDCQLTSFDFIALPLVLFVVMGMEKCQAREACRSVGGEVHNFGKVVYLNARMIGELGDGGRRKCWWALAPHAATFVVSFRFSYSWFLRSA